MEAKPSVTIRGGRTDVDGTFRIGLLSGDLDGWFEGETLRFTFEGMDEMEPIHGAGKAELEDDRLVFVLKLHGGDAYTFTCRRKRSRGPNAKKRAVAAKTKG